MRMQSTVLPSGRVVTGTFVAPRLDGVMIFGACDLAAARALFAGEAVTPIDAGGRALACVWLSDLAASTVGPYRELTLTLLVGERPLSLPWVNAMTPLAVQLRDDVLICEHTLLLDNDDAIAYGRILHGFDKHRGQLAFDATRGRYAFDVRESDGRLALAGSLAAPSVGEGAAALAALVRAAGVMVTARALTTRVHSLRVVTPRAVRAARSLLTFSGKVSLARWRASDVLRIGDGALVGARLAALRFRPTAVQHVSDASGRMPRLTS